MQDRVTICNDADGKIYARLALFFITIPAECHLDQLFVSSERLFNVDQHCWSSQE